MVAIEVTARHENEFFAKHALFTQEHVKLLQGFLDRDAAVDLFLGDSG